MSTPFLEKDRFLEAWSWTDGNLHCDNSRWPLLLPSLACWVFETWVRRRWEKLGGAGACKCPLSFYTPLYTARGYKERGGGSHTQDTGKNSHMPPTQHRTTSAISVIYITMQPLNHTHTTEELQQLPQWGKFLLNDHDQRRDLAMTLWMRALSFAGNLSIAQSNF